MNIIYNEAQLITNRLCKRQLKSQRVCGKVNLQMGYIINKDMLEKLQFILYSRRILQYCRSYILYKHYINITRFLVDYMSRGHQKFRYNKSSLQRTLCIRFLYVFDMIPCVSSNRIKTMKYLLGKLIWSNFIK